jgi:hypothetical protein
MTQSSSSLRIVPVLIAALAFASGWAFASAAPVATKVNAGLVNAFSEVGQNLFGEAVFDAVVKPTPPPISPAVQIDVALDSQIPTMLGVFVPPNPITPTDPCRKFVQLELSGGQVAIAVDPDAGPANFIPEIQFKDLSASAPTGIDRCVVGSVDAP